MPLVSGSACSSVTPSGGWFLIAVIVLLRFWPTLIAWFEQRR